MYSCLLREDGGILDDLIAYFLAEDWFRLVVNAGTADKDVAWILAQRDRLSPGLAVQPRRDLAMLAVQGPRCPRQRLAGAAANARWIPKDSRCFKGRRSASCSSLGPATRARTDSR